MAFSAAAGCWCTLTNRKSMSESTFRHGNNNRLSHRWTISSSRVQSSSSILYPNSNNSKLTYPNKGLGAGCSSRMMSTNEALPFVWPPKTAPWLSKTSPWLMLPPVFEGNNHNNNNMVYQFYTLGENNLLGLKKRNKEEEEEEKEEDGPTSRPPTWPEDRSTIVSSTRGWLALFNEHNWFMFLSNPLSRRHIKLPHFNTLRSPHGDWNFGGWGCPMKKRNECLVKQVILSSSDPDDPHCRALIIYGPRNRVAFCRPGHSTEWSPLGDRPGYASCAYSPRQNLFFCNWMDEQEWPPVDHFEAWDLRDPLSPRNIPMAFSADKGNYPLASRSEEEHDLKYFSNHKDDKFLVVAEASDELFHVRRFVSEKKGLHGYYVEDTYYGPKMGLDESVPYKTVGFDVHKYNPDTGSLEYMDRSLGGLAFFVGCNDGLALPAAEFPELKPDSIYYTCPPEWADNIGGHDVGIFNYQDNTLSSCYYPPDMQSRKRICAPKWFTPTPLIRFPFLVDNDDGSLSCAETKKEEENYAARCSTSARMTKTAEKVQVRFPDNNTLEVEFHSSDTVQHLVDLLNKVVAHPELPFYLYTTPPKKQIKDMSQDFYSACILPSGVVYFACDLPKGDDGAPFAGPFLKEDVMALKGL